LPSSVGAAPSVAVAGAAASASRHMATFKNRKQAPARGETSFTLVTPLS
jgi:hypothetical protein